MVEEITMESAQYLSAQAISELWGITKRRVQDLCVNNRIPGAFRIGNMWAIPADAVKPKDARVKKHTGGQLSQGGSVRKARRALKSIVESSVKEYSGKGISDVEALQTIVVLFAAKILRHHLCIEQDCIDVCSRFFRCSITTDIPTETIQAIDEFISKYDLFLDDSLSWVYQFITKKSDVFKYNDTQFFHLITGGRFFCYHISPSITCTVMRRFARSISRIHSGIAGSKDSGDAFFRFPPPAPSARTMPSAPVMPSALPA